MLEKECKIKLKHLKKQEDWLTKRKNNKSLFEKKLKFPLYKNMKQLNLLKKKKRYLRKNKIKMTKYI